MASLTFWEGPERGATIYGCEYPNRMEFINAGDPLPREIHSSTEMLAEFGQPIAMLTSQPPGTTPSIGGGGDFNGRIWYLDVDYVADHQLVARVRTIRELPSPPVHGQPGDLLRSTLIEFSVNAEAAYAVPTEDQGLPLGMRLTVRQEQLAALATPSDAEVTIDGNSHDAVALHIRGYRAYQTMRGKTTVIHVGTDDMTAPALRIGTAP